MWTSVIHGSKSISCVRRLASKPLTNTALYASNIDTFRLGDNEQLDMHVISWSGIRNYVTRAHGKPKDQYHIRQAVQLVLEGSAERDAKRFDKFVKKLEADDSSSENELNKKKNAYKGCDESVDIAIDTGLDPRKPNQSLRGSVRLPHGTGKKIRVAAFCNNEEQQAQAHDVGASIVGGDDLINEIASGGALDFDRAVATPDMSSSLGKVARILGPRGLLPSAKLGTISPDIADLVQNQLSGLAQYRTDKKGDIHACVGKTSFGEDKLLENIRVFMQEMYDEKPEGSKGVYLKQIYLTSTQGKGFKVSMPTIDPASALFMVDVEDADEKMAA